MVRAALAILALAAYACASSTGINSLLKRQTLSDSATQSVQGLLDLAQSVTNDVVAGNATADCTSWVTSLQNCSTISDETQVATCACGSDVLTQLNACAPTYGSTAASNAQSFSTFCTDTLPGLTSGSANSTVSSAASSDVASATSVLSSISSSASSAASRASSAAASSASHASTSRASSASSAPQATASGKSDAGKTAVAGGLAGVFALVAAFVM